MVILALFYDKELKRLMLSIKVKALYTHELSFKSASLFDIFEKAELRNRQANDLSKVLLS